MFLSKIYTVALKYLNIELNSRFCIVKNNFSSVYVTLLFVLSLNGERYKQFKITELSYRFYQFKIYIYIFRSSSHVMYDLKQIPQHKMLNFIENICFSIALGYTRKNIKSVLKNHALIIYKSFVRFMQDSIRLYTTRFGCIYHFSCTSAIFVYKS